MIYFYHHYELPVILQRYRLQQFLLTQRTTNANGDSVPFVSATLIRQDDAAGRSSASGAVSRPADVAATASPSVGHLHVIPVRTENAVQPSATLHPPPLQQSGLQQPLPRSWTLRIFSTFGVALRRHRHRLTRGGNEGRLGVENLIAGLTSQATHAVGTIRLLRRTDGGAAVDDHTEGAADERSSSAEMNGTSAASSAPYASPDDGFGAARVLEAVSAPASSSCAPTSHTAAAAQGAAVVGPDIIASTPTNVDACPDVVTSSSSAPPAPSLASTVTTPSSNAVDSAEVPAAESAHRTFETAESHKHVTDGSNYETAQRGTSQWKVTVCVCASFARDRKHIFISRRTVHSILWPLRSEVCKSFFDEKGACPKEANVQF